MDRHYILSTRKALFRKEKYIQAIQEAKPKLIKIAYEQMSLLKTA